ncbi:MAG: hypothetical protein ACFFD4_12440 [Candidatus Odinarchaeota archaeon]
MLVKLKDELGSVARNFNTFIGFQQKRVKAIREAGERLPTSSKDYTSSAEELNASSEEIASVIQQMNRGAQQQTGHVTSTVTNMKVLVGTSQKSSLASRHGRTHDRRDTQTSIHALNAAIEAPAREIMAADLPWWLITSAAWPETPR